ncbi:hypothetical protein [Azospirillum sp. SYSU D00513]|uniref:hypothetical protein n=1 Tax=Azospirillum sp. SYSU D00513 TaxID=2812561 RepID=UPI001FFE3287|nr:hypothetical protein [Azospirillum sp. SYSU D00513]
MMLPDLPQFQTDLFIPAYRPMSSGEWELRRPATVLCPGYWSGPVLAVNMVGLVRRGATWMSMTPMELESQEIGVRLAHGHVVIFGMGMGWAACVSALRDEVTAVTVVELDEDVLALHRELDVFSQLPEQARAKIRVERGNAYEWTPREPVDLLMPDIWLPLVSDGRVEEVRRMQANVQAKEIYFWGQEMEIARHAVAAGRTLDDAGIRATIESFGLPLIGTDYPDYAGKLNAAARRWMRGRWLPGTVPPF